MTQQSPRQQWPDGDDKQIVTAMLNDSASPHWDKCRKFFVRLVVRAKVPVDHREDVVQNALVTVHRSLPAFEHRSRLRTWLVLILRSRVADLYRTLERDRRQIDLSNAVRDDDEDVPGREMFLAPRTTEQQALAHEDLHEIVEALQRYASTRQDPERSWHILEKVLIEQFSVEDVAKELGVEVHVVRYCVYAAQAYLRKWRRRA